MSWSELRRVLLSTLKASRRPGKKHDMWFVECNGKLVAEVLDSHGSGEMRGHEIGHVASSLGLSELKALVRGQMTRQRAIDLAYADGIFTLSSTSSFPLISGTTPPFERRPGELVEESDFAPLRLCVFALNPLLQSATSS
jgi:hypothetical protein